MREHHTPPHQRPVMSTRRSIDGIVSRPLVHPTITQRTATQAQRAMSIPSRPGITGYHPRTTQFVDNVIVDKRPLGRPPAATHASPSPQEVARPAVMDVLPRTQASAARVSGVPLHDSVHQESRDNTSTETSSPSKTLTRQKSTTKKKGVIRDFVANLGVTLLAVVVGISFFDQTVGIIIISIASVVGLILKLDSRYYFGAAVFALVMIPILSLLGRADMSNNYAVYAFVMMVFGTIASVVELMRQGWHAKKIRKKTAA